MVTAVLEGDLHDGRIFHIVVHATYRAGSNRWFQMAVFSVHNKFSDAMVVSVQEFQNTENTAGGRSSKEVT